MDGAGAAMRTLAAAGRRVAVIGDVGGHLGALRDELVRLGADPERGRLPADLVVVQVGDLVHRGPDSDGVIALVDHYLTEQPDQWVQLVGNHETQYLHHDPVFAWPERIGVRAVRAVQRWWREGLLHAAVALRADGEELLISHAGLTEAYWRRVLGAPARAAAAAAALEEMLRRDDRRLFLPGQMVGGREADPMAGPLWAAAATELLPGWRGVSLPFSQVHGHSAMTRWDAAASPGADPDRAVDRDRLARHETVHLEGGRIIGIDPGHDDRARTPWRAWEVGP